MITDQEIIDLYRALLGRDPEGPGTIAAFKNYYPTLERGRRAIFASAEFHTFYTRTTGRVLNQADHAAASLALAFLERAASLAPVPPPAPPDDTLRAGMRRFFEADHPAIAVAVGHPTGLRLDDLIPLGRPEAAVLHVAPGFPPAVPVAARLEDGTTVFRMGGDPAAIAAFLAIHGRRVDALYLLDRSAGPDWVDQLRVHFTEPALVVIGRPGDRFDPAALNQAIRHAHNCETLIEWRGLLLNQVGGWRLPVTYEPPALPPPPPKREAFPSLAIAAIVCNEAVCVENMLRSAAPVASFFAVLDTGSTDATPAIAQRALAASGIAYAFDRQDRTAVFANDFSAMRNAALAMVPDWIDWVLMLDADEEIVAEDLPALLELIAQADVQGAECFAMPRYNFRHADKSDEVMSYPDMQRRLLRNTKDRRIRYSGAVHETVKSTPYVKLPLDASAIGGARGGPHIHHLVRRFRSAAEEDRKQEFYREIARRNAAKETAP